MKMIITEKELVLVGEVVLKGEKIATAINEEFAKEMALDAKTDREKLDIMFGGLAEMLRKAGCEVAPVEIEGKKMYTIEVPEKYTKIFMEEAFELMNIGTPIVMKVAKFINKHKDVLNKVAKHIKATIDTLAPILAGAKANEMDKDFEEILDEVKNAQDKIREHNRRH